MSRPASAIVPARCRVTPTSVSMRVDLPAPFRPSRASEPPASMENDTPSRTMASPYPARKPSTRRSSGNARLPEIDRLHAAIARDFVVGALREQGSIHHHRNPRRKAEHEIHVVLDEEDRDIGGKRRERVEDFARLSGGHAGHGLIQEKNARTSRDGDGDLEEPALSVGQHRGLLLEDIGEVELPE